MDVVRRVAAHRLLLCYSSLWQPVMERFSLLLPRYLSLTLSLSYSVDSIGHNWLLFESRY